MNPTEDPKAARDAVLEKLTAKSQTIQEEVTPTLEPEAQAAADIEIAQRGPSVMQQVQGLGIEMGGAIGGTYFTHKALKTQKVAKGLNILKNIRRAGQATVMAGSVGPQAFEPISTVGSVALFGLTEAAWSVGSNFVKQEYFKALGVQEETSGGELLASGLLISPLIRQGNKIPKIGQVFDTAMINSRKWRVGAHVVQGSVIGAVESSIRQTFDLMADENSSIGDFSMQDFFTGAAGGAILGGGIGGLTETIGLVKTYRAVVARSKVEMRGSLVEKLATIDAAIKKAEAMGRGGRYSGRYKSVKKKHYAETKKKLEELDAVHDSIDEKLGEAELALDNQLNPEPAAPATPKEEIAEVVAEGQRVIAKEETSSHMIVMNDPTYKRSMDALQGRLDNGQITVEEWMEQSSVVIKEAYDRLGFGWKPLKPIDAQGRPIETPATPKPEPEAPATPKETPEGEVATPKVDPEGSAPEKTPFKALIDDYDKAIEEKSKGRGADEIIALNKHFNAISDDFTKKADALIANPDAESVDDLLVMLDDYTAYDAKDAELKQKTGQEGRAQGRDAGEADFERENMSPERKIRNEALKSVREKLQSMKDDADGSELQKLVDGIFTYPEPVKGKSTRNKPEAPTATPKDGEAPVVTPKETETPIVEPKAPKKTPQERTIARLQKKLDELRAIRSSTASALDSPKKPKKAKSAEEVDLEERIKFYQGEGKEVAEITATAERIQVLSGLLQGADIATIRQQIGLPHKFRPSQTKSTKAQTKTLTKLKAAEANLMKRLRRKQTDAILSDMRNVFDPANGSRSTVDSVLNGYLMMRTDAMLNQPSTATTGLPSGVINILYRPTINTASNTLRALNPADRALKGIPMTQRMKYAAADIIATKEQFVNLAQNPIIVLKQMGRNTADTFNQGGSSGYFYKDANKIDMRDSAISAGNSSIRNTQKVNQADIRAKANEEKRLIVRKAMQLMGTDFMSGLLILAKKGWSAGRSAVGALDEPFNLILEGRAHRAEAIRESIKQQIKPEDVAKFIADYIAKTSTIDKGGIKRFNYLDEKYKNTANQTRKALFRPSDLDAKDPRVLMEEHFVRWTRSTFGGDLTVGKLFGRFLFNIITTPTIALSQSARKAVSVTGLPTATDVSQRMYAGAAKRIGKQGQISGVFSGNVNSKINDLEIKVKEIEVTTREKGIDADELETRQKSLSAQKSELESLRDYRDEQTYEKIALMAISMGIAYSYFELGKEGLATGAGAYLERDQRNDGQFQKYRMLADEESEGISYLLGDPFRFLAAIFADLGAWHALGDSRTEGQNLGNFISNTLEAFATDSVFTTNLRHLKDLAFGKEKSRLSSAIDMTASAIPAPSFVRSASTLSAENYSLYDEGASWLDMGDNFSRAFDKATGEEGKNFRLDKLGRPLLRTERGALNYVARFAPEDRAYRTAAEEEVNNVMRNDSITFNIISKLTHNRTINGVQINMKDFSSSGRSLFQLFGELLNEGDEMLYEMHDMVMDEDWQELDYNNGIVFKDPDKPEKYTNKGLVKLKNIRKKYIDKAMKTISNETNINLFKNKKGLTVHEYIESLSESAEKSGNFFEKFPNLK